MNIIIITVENKEQKDEIIKVLDNAEVNGELDFAFNVSTTSAPRHKPVVI